MSIEKYFKDFRNIYFITNNGKLPPCIEVKKNYIPILDYDLVGNRTYNSNSIETSLHKIEGLSEYYLYLNDDFLLAKPTSISDFIDEKTKKLIWYEESSMIHKFFNKYPKINKIWNKLFRKHDHIVSIARNKLYKKLNYKKKPNQIGHCPRMFKKSMVIDFYENFKEEIEYQKKQIVRSENDFPFVDAFCFYYLQKNELIFRSNLNTLILNQFDFKLISKIVNKKISNKYHFICIQDLRKDLDIDKNVLEIISNYFK